MGQRRGTGARSKKSGRAEKTRLRILSIQKGRRAKALRDQRTNAIIAARPSSIRKRAAKARTAAIARTRRVSSRKATKSRTRSTTIKAKTTTRKAPSTQRVSFITKPAPKTKRTPASRFRFGKNRGSSRTIGGLSPAVIRAQQKLSNKFGVTTFNKRGGFSTVPSLQSGGFSDINVGIGKFSDFNKFAEAAIQKQVGIEVNTRQKTGSGVTLNDFGSLVPTASADSPIFVSDPREPQRFFNKETGDFNSSSGFDFDSLVDKAPLGIAVFIGIILVLRLVKKI